MTTHPSDLPEPAHDDPADDDKPTTEDPDATPAESDEPAEPDAEEQTRQPMAEQPGWISDPQTADIPDRPEVADDDLTSEEPAQVHRAGESIGKGVCDAFEEFPDGAQAAGGGLTVPVSDMPAMPPTDSPGNGSRMPDEAPELEEPGAEAEASADHPFVWAGGGEGDGRGTAGGRGGGAGGASDDLAQRLPVQEPRSREVDDSVG